MNEFKKTAKMSYEVIRQFVTKEKNISGKAIDFMMYSIQFVDKDGRIYMDIDKAKRVLYMQKKQLERVIKELQDHNLLTYKHGFFYSLFHVNSMEKNDKAYIRGLPVFLSKNVQEMSKNKKRMFYYIVTLAYRGQYGATSVENLYRNNLNAANEYACNFFDDFKTMSDVLFSFIDDGLVNVRIDKLSDHLNIKQIGKMESSDQGFKSFFNSYCGFEDGRKKRTSKFFKKKHRIAVKLNPEVFNVESIDNKASEEEFRIYAAQYNIYYEVIRKDTINILVGLKNRLVSLLGEVGLTLYRSSLKRYLKEQKDNILYYDHDSEKKAAVSDYFKDFYLLNDIKDLLIAALKYTAGERDALIKTGYEFSKMHIPKLIKFFMEESSVNHKIIFDSEIELIKNAHEVLDDVSGEEDWLELGEEIQRIYNIQRSIIENDLKRLGQEYHIERGERLIKDRNFIEQVRNWAQRGLLQGKKAHEARIVELKEKVLIMKKNYENMIYESIINQPKQARERRVSKPYNWLDA